MIGQKITLKDGKPTDASGNALSESTYNPSDEVKQLFARVQLDYQTAYDLQHQGMSEFDGLSLLQRSKLDQETFGAYVGSDYVAPHKRWRWRGRKNTSRNKLIGILAHMLAGMLFPFVHAKNEENEEDKMTARVMRILVEEHLRKAGYEMKFLFTVLTALVNPAVFVEVEYVQAMQTIKQRLANGTIKVIQAVDELLSGLNLNIVPIDELLLGDFYTGNIQRQPYLIRVRRISYDQAKKIYGNNPNFSFVQAGQTRIVLAGQEGQTLYDIQWSEADSNFVQELTAYYRDEDLQVTWIGGTFIGNEDNVYNSNPFQHRRLTLIKEEWLSVPIYPFAKTYFEPLDPTGRFAYGKSAAFKEYWDDQALNTMHRLVLDGTYLDIIKPMFLSGVAKVDGIVLAPGATTGMPQGSTVTPFSVGPNLKAAYDAIAQQEKDLSVSTQDETNNGVTDPNVTATQTQIAQQQAKIMLGVFGIMIADLITQIGELTMDCIVQYTTVGDVDMSTPGSLSMKYQTFLAKGKDKGKDVTNRIIFTDEYMGQNLSDKQVQDAEWKLYHKTGGNDSDQRIYKVNPYQFARNTYSMWVDADKILDKSTGNDERKKMTAFNILTDPRVAPFTDQKAVVDDFAIETYGGDDPEKYKIKTPIDPNMGGGPPMPGGKVVPPQKLPANKAPIA